MAELPGIMAWCCEGYRDLIECGHSSETMPRSARLEGLSPVHLVLSFMRDCL